MSSFGPTDPERDRFARRGLAWRWPLPAHLALLPIPAISLLADVVLRHRQMAGWSAAKWLAYALAWAVSVAAWALLSGVAAATNRARPRVARALVPLVSALIVAWFFIGLIHYREFDAYLSWADLVFITTEGRNGSETAGLFSGLLSLPVLAGGTLGVAGLSAFWFRSLRPAGPAPTAHGRRRLWALAAVVVSLGAGRAAWRDMSELTTLDASFPLAVAEFAAYHVARTEGAYHAATRPDLPAVAPPAEPVNVLLLVHESLSRNRMSLFGYAKETTPLLETFARGRGEALVVFPRGTANSGNTSISLPTLLTGLPPQASLAAFHEAPFLWQYARAAKYRTFLLSAQSYRYSHFHDYFYSAPPDEIWTAESRSDVALSNGGGMDDVEFMPRVKAVLDAVGGRPFCGVVQFNATHHPFHPGRSGLRPQFTDDRVGRYENAVYTVDTLMHQLFDDLQRRGLLENTLVVLTSDHGENHGEHQAHRTQSCYEEVIGVPFLVYLPRRLRERRPELRAALERLRQTPVQNLDVLPTLLDAMGLLDEPGLQPYTAALGGSSLLGPVDPGRVIVAMNNTEARHWVNESFGLVRGDEKYIFSERYGEELFDLVSDPGERDNRWPALPEPPPWVVATVKTFPYLRGIRERHCGSIPGCVPW